MANRYDGLKDVDPVLLQEYKISQHLKELEGEKKDPDLDNFPLSKEGQKKVQEYESHPPLQKNTFKIWFYGKHGFWPARSGEDYTTVFTRLANGMSEYLEEELENIKIQLG